MTIQSTWIPNDPLHQVGGKKTDKQKFLVEKLEQFLNESQSRRGLQERVLAHLLPVCKDNWPSLDVPPEQFMKDFRQRDITHSGHIDISIWTLMMESEIVWGMIVDAFYYRKDKK